MDKKRFDLMESWEPSDDELEEIYKLSINKKFAVKAIETSISFIAEKSNVTSISLALSFHGDEALREEVAEMVAFAAKATFFDWKMEKEEKYKESSIQH